MRTFSFLAVLALLAVAAPGAAIAGPDGVVVPNVVGQTRAAALQRLALTGLGGRAVDIADGVVGQVHSQRPVAGAKIPPGQAVEVRIGTAVRVDTVTPDARGRRLEEVMATLEAAYVIDVLPVADSQGEPGMVVDQKPLPGQPLLFRGVLTLGVVDPGAASEAPIVPSVLGKPEAEAVAALEALGLRGAVSSVDEPAAPPGTVVSQDPASGAEIVPGGTVALRVAAESNAPQVPGTLMVPLVVGTTFQAAQQALLLAGFAVQADFSTTVAHAPWSVFDQSPKAGTAATAGSVVRIAVALQGLPSSVHVPSVYGLGVPAIQQVLAALNLVAQFVQQPANQPPGTAFGQSPSPGTLVPTGSVVKVLVAKELANEPPPATVAVPHVVGQSPEQAFLTLVAAGLWPTQHKHLAPSAPLGLVDVQIPAPGTPVGIGSHVKIYVPHTAHVPALVGKSKGQATTLLQQAGLVALPQGPLVGLPPTVVLSQSVAPGEVVTRGSTIAFTFKFAGQPQPQQVPVPNLIGMTKGQAQQALQAKGLVANFQGPQFGVGTTKVVNQNPNAGTPVPVGSAVLVQYVFAPVQVQVQVPNLLGLTKTQAGQALQAKGLQPSFQGPQIGIGATKVVHQDPAAGTLVPSGSAVLVKYVFGPGQMGVQVPNVIGMTKAQAAQALQAKGLQPNFQGPQLGIGTTKVVATNPPAGTVVAAGSVVNVQYVFDANQGGLVQVPPVVGLTKNAAKAALQAKGLVPKFLGPQLGIGTPKVANQVPAAGTAVPAGSQVTLVIVWQ